MILRNNIDEIIIEKIDDIKVKDVKAEELKKNSVATTTESCKDQKSRNLIHL